MTETLVPNTLDNLPKLIFWDIDVVMFFMLPAGLGMFTGHGFVGLLTGALAAWGYSQLKAGKARGFARHLVYWHLPVKLGFKRTPPSYIREFVG